MRYLWNVSRRLVYVAVFYATLVAILFAAVVISSARPPGRPLTSESPASSWENSAKPLPGGDDIQLRLAHIFHRGGSKEDPRVFRRLDISTEDDLVAHTALTGQSFVHTVSSVNVRKPTSASWQQQQRSSPKKPMKDWLSSQNDRDDNLWLTPTGTDEYITVPNYTDPLTVLNFALMTSNTYLPLNSSRWLDMGEWNVTEGFGWDDDGVRGYVYKDGQGNIVLAYKGTSASVFGIGGGGTSARDKYNDNMMFSCCCGKAGPTWWPLCDCCGSAYKTCNATCLNAAAHYNDSYYDYAQDIFLATKQLNPDAKNVWVAGHSLGGALASLVALTNNVACFAYEAVGEVSFARRLGLLPPASQPLPADLPIYHFGNLGDPVFMGACNGPLSSCWFGGYALETKCHAGKSCVYDPDDVRAKKRLSMNGFSDWVNAVDEENGGTQVFPYARDGGVRYDAAAGWNTFDDGRDPDPDPDARANTSAAMNIRYHQINNVIRLFLQDAETVPPCIAETNCTDCEIWEYGD
ncbi:Alpha/Beta hydrolase protein [Fimicolochytrium jonesii]|uniref:Alpha/Beta hydrolase protein n=1 Tax=Fimicolochytrium jonesii TaxID=1396493 RepID=UPI0022FEECA7|nr:Alpha/Beta hydrolase protein [Fimicolochytrium jonesii]KAI8816082.1 Alpha/Beta hydrolase protein [Fimicolochytrium jonesii]